MFILFFLGFISLSYAKDFLPEVANGNQTVPGQYPFLVIFYDKKPRQTKLDKFLSPLCSGTIISRRWILTTAMPLGALPIDSYFVLTSQEEISREYDSVTSSTGYIYHVVELIVHPKWQSRRHFDIAMAKTDVSMIFGTARIPKHLEIPADNETICEIPIWASKTQMDKIQPLDMSRHLLRFVVTDEIGNYKEGNFFPPKNLCLLQTNVERKKDICAVNTGTVIVGHCRPIDQPMWSYTTFNLVKHIEWIRKINDAPISPKALLMKSRDNLFSSESTIRNMIPTLFMIFNCFVMR